jgi:NitT/TauT family transport system permease protein
MKSVSPALLKIARSTGASRLYIAWTVILPWAAPSVVTGIRLGFGAAFLAIVAAEMFGATYGLGFLTLEMSQTFKIVDMYAAILAIGVIGWTVNAVVVLSLRWLAPWQDHGNRK